MRRVARRFFAIASWIVVGAAILVAGGFVILTVGFGWQFSTVLTGSMEPKYPVGSMVIVVPTPSEDIAVGDVITFEMNGRRVSHRVIDVKRGESGRLFSTKGDANNIADRDPVPERSVVGRVEGGVPAVGGVMRWMRTPLGMGVTAGVLAASVLLGPAFRRRDESAELGGRG